MYCIESNVFSRDFITEQMYRCNASFVSLWSKFVDEIFVVVVLLWCRLSKCDLKSGF